MPGPIHTPTVLFLYRFRYRDAVSGKWIRERQVPERREIAARYREWEITGEPETRRIDGGGSVNPWR